MTMTSVMMTPVAFRVHGLEWLLQSGCAQEHALPAIPLTASRQSTPLAEASMWHQSRDVCALGNTRPAPEMETPSVQSAMRDLLRDEHKLEGQTSGAGPTAGGGRLR